MWEKIKKVGVAAGKVITYTASIITIVDYIIRYIF